MDAKMSRQDINRRYRAKHKEEIAAYNKAYYAKNRDSILAQKAVYNAKHKEEKAARQQVRRQTPEGRKVARRHNHNYKARRRGLVADLTQEQWEKILLDFSNECAYCGDTRDLEQDHIIPVSRGGGYTKENIIPACRSCNASKGDKLIIEWLPKRVLL
jgi:5-methylcytosine-specific restriction endonuclease McrA